MNCLRIVAQLAMLPFRRGEYRFESCRAIAIFTCLCSITVMLPASNGFYAGSIPVKGSNRELLKRLRGQFAKLLGRCKKLVHGFKSHTLYNT